MDTGSESEIVFATGVGIDPVQGDDTKLVLRSSSETVGLAGLTASNVSLFLITDQTSTFFDNPFDGIMGLGSQATTNQSSHPDGLFFSRLVQAGLEPMFGLILTDFEDGGAQLTLGGVDATQFSGEPMFSPLADTTGSHWTLVSQGIAVGTDSVRDTKNLHVVFDSGTSTLAFDPKLSKVLPSLTRCLLVDHGLAEHLRARLARDST